MRKHRKALRASKFKKIAVIIDLITAIIELIIALLELLSIIVGWLRERKVAWSLASLLVYSKKYFDSKGYIKMDAKKAAEWIRGAALIILLIALVLAFVKRWGLLWVHQPKDVPIQNGRPRIVPKLGSIH